MINGGLPSSVYIAMPDWLTHVPNISATLHRPKRHPSDFETLKMVSTVPIAAAALK
jgi:hypothetical protein